LVFLIDLTDARFKIPANEAVIDFIRGTNPFAHSDIGSKLIALGKATAGAHAYCPSYSSCAYVVLHTAAQAIFAIAFDMRKLAFRLPPAAMASGLEQGGRVCTEIGEDWLCADAFRSPGGGAMSDATLQQWAEAACRSATERARHP
jgi:hypothetical protein